MTSPKQTGDSLVSPGTKSAVHPEAHKYDVIMIGSGMGALTTAMLLAKEQKKKVLILEQHFKAGGFTHTFSRGPFTWDVGLHYIGDLHPKTAVRKMYDYVTGQKLKWQKIPDPFQYLVFPDRKIAVRSTQKEYADELKKSFPLEAEKIDRYFFDVRRVQKYSPLFMLIGKAPEFLRSVLKKIFASRYRYFEMRTDEFFDELGLSHELRAVLDAQCGDYGLAMHESALLAHIAIATHYLRGAYYPTGGSGQIVRAILPEILNAGGKIMVRHEVQEILLSEDQKTAIGVRVLDRRDQSTHEFFAPLIYSNAGVHITYQKLLPEAVTQGVRQKLEKIPLGYGVVNLYLGLKKSPKEIGVHGENYWIYDSYDQKKVFAERNQILAGHPAFAFLSFGAANDSEAKSFTAQIISLADYELFAKYKTLPTKNRGPEYEALKAEISKNLLAMVEKHVPGLTDLIEYQELATPLTFEHYTGHIKGQIYGLSMTVDRAKNGFYTAKTPVNNLYLTGADVAGSGVTGALFSGVLAYAEVFGLRIMGKIMRTR